MYATSTGHVAALDLATGCIAWSFTPPPQLGMCIVRHECVRCVSMCLCVAVCVGEPAGLQGPCVCATVMHTDVSGGMRGGKQAR
jgi:hypothetical protein